MWLRNGNFLQMYLCWTLPSSSYEVANSPRITGYKEDPVEPFRDDTISWTLQNENRWEISFSSPDIVHVWEEPGAKVRCLYRPSLHN
mmetsp:Transcript_5716/g.12573  ORF Transcript_5716/g.12573 Transcript_5716/m.12573 type:complete len:87 (+) Transcript_5716:57-317(+)